MYRQGLQTGLEALEKVVILPCRWTYDHDFIEGASAFEVLPALPVRDASKGLYSSIEIRSTLRDSPVRPSKHRKHEQYVASITSTE